MLLHGHLHLIVSCTDAWAVQKLQNQPNKLCGRPPQYAPPCKSTFDLLTLKVVSKSRVTWATSMPILVFLGFCSRLRRDVCNRQTSDRQTSDTHHHCLVPPPYIGAGHNKVWHFSVQQFDSFTNHECNVQMNCRAEFLTDHSKCS